MVETTVRKIGSIFAFHAFVYARSIEKPGKAATDAVILIQNIDAGIYLIPQSSTNEAKPPWSKFKRNQ